MTLKQTPSQTIGPFFGYGLTPRPYGFGYADAAGRILTHDTVDGEHIELVGQVFDGNGDPVTDAMIELWQANAHGRYNHPADERADNLGDPAFSGFGRCGTGMDDSGFFRFRTIKPGQVSPTDAPHVTLLIFMRGILNHVYTRAYFSDEAAANATDPVLSHVEPARRPTLIAARQEGPKGTVYRFDIRMQGDQETVFFDV